MDKKVSIITPCFNGEKFISRYFDSILEQTYKNIEVIFINDGSTDTTEKIVEQYIPMFNKYGIEFIYIYQENKGQAAALNNGLKKFSGDYLTWPDSDDILTKDSIEKKVFFLENNKQYGLVRSGAKVVLENNLHDIIGYLGKNNKNKFKEDLFLDYIIENDVWFAPGCFMIRADNFLEVNPMREIYEGRGGQNWQMLLPLMYKYKCGYIDEELYIYIIRENSHSHDIEGFEQEYKRCMEHEKILINCIKNIDMNESEREKYFKIINEKYVRRNFLLSVDYNKKELAEELYKVIKKKYKVSKYEYLQYLSSRSIVLKVFIDILRFIKKLLINWNLLG